MHNFKKTSVSSGVKKPFSSLLLSSDKPCLIFFNIMPTIQIERTSSLLPKDTTSSISAPTSSSKCLRVLTPIFINSSEIIAISSQDEPKRDPLRIGSNNSQCKEVDVPSLFVSISLQVFKTLT
ncbi:hypothetical protein CHARACLAT_021339 [Characodon lateralis]|uniref:Uncharacterized protein n=1 Tax=Characodon lateralis TaxID=208331 RepID=A0ABU7CQS1_9TELE|nr:hypothetical protein [Characodon lateralis]